MKWNLQEPERKITDPVRIEICQLVHKLLSDMEHMDRPFFTMPLHWQFTNMHRHVESLLEWEIDSAVLETIIAFNTERKMKS